jgi:acyl-coenzyme A synthetase/AMP-(fatty) acid ligase/thioesterase domain-containing protein/acyl carrier protein
VVDLVEGQVEQQPDALAVRADDGELTYGELDRCANRIAHAVLAADPDRRSPHIGVLLPTGTAPIAAMLGVAKAGRAAIGLDREAPPEHLAGLGEQTGPLLVVTDRDHRPTLPADWTAVLVEDLPAEDHRPCIAIEPGDALQLSFTSGSTGRRKGSAQTHGAQAAEILDRLAVSGYGPGVRVGLLYDVAFPVCRVLLWGGLGTGCSLHVRDVRRLGARGLAPWLHDERVARLYVPASLFVALLDTEPPDAPLDGLVALTFSGEPLRVTTARRAFAVLGPDATVENSYGSAETGGIAGYVMTADTPLDGELVPAGHLRAGVEVRIVEPDDAGVGELEVTGPLVAAGYVDARGDPRGFFVDAAGRPWFRSGDLGRLRSDGVLEVVGRRDDRLKIRGHTVDPVEIEHALLALDEVRDAHVTAKEVQGRSRLVAYIRAVPGATPTVTSVRRGLRAKLPGWMIPQSVLVLDALPRNATGKVDRSALPSPGGERPPLDVAFAPPVTPVETSAVQAFEQVLGVEGVGRDDEFFDLGGDSLSAVEVIVQLGRQLGRELELDTFRTSATPAAIAARLAEDPEDVHDRFVVFHDRGSATPIVHVHSGHGFTISMAHVAATTEGSRPFVGVQMLHRDRTRDLLTVDRLAARYADLLDDRRPGPLVVSGYSGGSFLAHAVAAELERRGRPIVALVLLDPPGRPGADLRVRDLGYLGVTLSGWRLPMSRRVQERTVASAWGARFHRPGVIQAPILLLRGEIADPAPWAVRTSGGLVVREITGDHRAMLDPPHVERLGVEVEAGLRRLEDGLPSSPVKG